MWSCDYCGIVILIGRSLGLSHDDLEWFLKLDDIGHPSSTITYAEDYKYDDWCNAPAREHLLHRKGNRAGGHSLYPHITCCIRHPADADRWKWHRASPLDISRAVRWTWQDPRWSATVDVWPPIYAPEDIADESSSSLHWCLAFTASTLHSLCPDVFLNAYAGGWMVDVWLWIIAGDPSGSWVSSIQCGSSLDS